MAAATARCSLAIACDGLSPRLNSRDTHDSADTNNTLNTMYYSFLLYSVGHMYPAYVPRKGSDSRDSANSLDSRIPPPLY